MFKRTYSLWATLALIALLFNSCKKEKNINNSGNLVPKTVDQDPSLPSITINGAKLHAEAFGHPDSSIILVLHGGPGSDYRYLLNCKEFANYGYRVIFYDQRGSGLSQRFPRKSYNDLQVLYDEVTGVINHYKTHDSQKVFLLGHSWGAMLATAYINRYPGGGTNIPVIAGAVLCEPGGFIWSDVKEYVATSRDFKLASEFLNDATYLDQFITGKEDQHEILDYKMQLMAAENTITGETGELFWRAGAEINNGLYNTGEKIKPNWTGNLHLYTTKVLFVYSEKNKAYGLNWAKKVSSAYPEVKLFQANNAGHSMLTDPQGWQNCFPEILAYLQSH